MPPLLKKISVITINRNNGAGLAQTMASVLQQDYSELEYIVIDGASSDDSVSQIRKNESRLHYWCSEPDTGIYNAMNKGIARATGEYVLFLNSGDYLYSNTILARIAAQLNGEEMVYGNLGLLQQQKLRILPSPARVEYNLRYQHDLPAQPVTFIKRSLFSTVGLFDETYRIISDVIFISRIFARREVTYKYVPELVTIFDTNGISSTAGNQESIYEERKKFIMTDFPHYLEDFEKKYATNRLQQTITKLKKYFT